MSPPTSSDGLHLPPSADPIVPPDLTEGGDAWYEPPVRPVAGHGRYSVLAMDWTAPSIDFDWPNMASTSDPSPSQGKFETLPEAPLWRTNEPEPDDFAEVIRGATYTVSRRVRDVFLRHDPGSLKYQEVKIRFKEDAPSRRDH